MQIRAATIDDAEHIKQVHLQAFNNSEAQMVANLAANLLNYSKFYQEPPTQATS